ncbi:hypothetical protein Krac_11111 [Ktedonobacter racemifer DSM 44963]|uniref:Uncharacterized protein n=1 Tax=Ktedonobacter racemifer DSM 44963 TaxID=485913 RepID=D6TJE0_KTERA|nr:hypothetical protein Krac_11111 [Ktedonobacter racemifer DSM 44963]
MNVRQKQVEWNATRVTPVGARSDAGYFLLPYFFSENPEREALATRVALGFGIRS